MLSLLIELQRLKRLDRTGWTLRGLPNGTESVAAHSFGVACTAMLLADELSRQGVDINVEKVIRISLLHDWAETRVGDMPRTAKMYFGEEVTRKAEMGAFTEIVRQLNGANTYLDLYEDYESRLSLEARVVKAADVIDLLIQVLALEKAGARGLDEFWEIAENPDFRLTGPAKEITNQLVLSLVHARRELLQVSRQ